MADPTPEVRERLTRAFAAAGREAEGRDSGIHRARTRGADALEGYALVFEEPVQHAPGKGAMSTAALEREVDRLDLRHRRGLCSRPRLGGGLPDQGRHGHLSLPSPSDQWAVQPPSMGRAVPVIEAAPTLQRKTASIPSSSTIAKRLEGCWARRTSRITRSRGMPWLF